MESYRIFLTDEESEIEFGQVESLYWNPQTIFKNDTISIIQSVPRYIGNDGNFEIKVSLQKYKILRDNIEFAYDLSSNYISGLVDSKIIHITFNEKTFANKDEYSFFIKAKATSNIPQITTIEICRDSFMLSIGDDIINTAIQNSWNIEIIEEDVRERVKGDYFDLNMEDILKERADENKYKIYLAKIYFITYKNSYIIEKIIAAPFKQYINTPFLELPQTIIKQDIIPVTSITKTFENRMFDILKKYLELSSLHPYMSSGTTQIELGLKAKKNSVFISEDILHGLGEGAVDISTGILHENVVENEILYGDSSIFFTESMKNLPPKLTIAVLLNAGTGTFKIGVRILEATNISQLNIAWSAFKDNRNKGIKSSGKSLFISPDIVKLSCRQEYRFDLDANGIDKYEVTWAIVESKGGFIKNDGLYNAPSIPGIYEINVTYEELLARAFVIVS